MLTCPKCGAAAISEMRALMPSFGAVVTCPACKAPLRNTSQKATNYSGAVVIAFFPMWRLTAEWPVATVVLLAALTALACYLYLRLIRLEPIAVELDPNKWTVRRALRSRGGD